MKKKLSLIVMVAMLSVVCFGVLAACGGLSDFALNTFVTQLENQFDNAQGQSYTLDAVLTMTDVDETVYTCAVEWKSTDHTDIEFKKNGDKVNVTVPDGIDSYILVGTLVDGNGKAYDVEGNPVMKSVSVNGSNQGNQGNQGDNQGNQGDQGNQGNQGGDTPKTVKEQFLDQVVKAPQAGTNYALAMYYGLPDAVYYAKANVTSYKLDSTTAVGEAAVATVETTTNGYYIKLGGKYLNIVSSKSGTKTYYNISLDSAANTVFTIDSNGVLLGAVGEDTYYIGTYQNGTDTKLYTAMGANWSGYLTKDGNTLDGNQFPARLIPSNATITGGNTTGGNTTGGDVTPTGDSITLAYVGGTTVDAQTLSTSTNYATYLCADYSSTVTVTSTSKPNLAGLNKANQIRLYANDSQATELTISIKGYKITSVQVTIVADTATEKNKTDGASIVIGTDAAVDAHASKTVTSTVNASSVTIAAQSSSGSKQVWITQIVIYIEAL